MDRDQFVAYLDDLLDADQIRDVALNGLQVAGRPEIERVATGVSASAALFRAAVEWEADAVLVHHGLLWRGGEPPRLVGAFRERIRLLLDGDVNLIAYHLPLDRHPGYGNAAVLARELGIDQLEAFGEFDGTPLGVAGLLPVPVPVPEFAARLFAACGQKPLHLPGGPERIASVGVVTGGAPDGLDEAIAAGLDAYVTGEAREWTMQRAAEEGIHFFAAGHYATEVFGIRSLGSFLAQRFGLEVTFIDLPNPV